MLALALLCLSGCAGYAWPERVENLSDSMKFFENGTLFIVVGRQVRYRYIVIGSGDQTRSATRYYYRLGFRLPKGGGSAELASVDEVYRKHRVGGPAPSLYDRQLAPLISQHREDLFLAGNDLAVTQKPAGAIGLEARRWNGGLWLLFWREDQPYTVTDESQSIAYACPPLDTVLPRANCWDANLGLVLFTANLGERPPPPRLDYLPPKAYLWYYRENRVETYTIDRVAVDKALRQFIRQQK
jgi:hypothetical protein